MEKRLRNFMVGSSLAAVGFGVAGAVHAATTRYLVNVALNREAPKYTAKAGQRLSGTEQDAGWIRRRIECGRQLKSRGGERIQTAGRENVQLVGHWFPAAEPNRVIIAMHGWRSSWCNDFGFIVDFWLENGCSVLLAEQRGQGESGGTHMGFGLLERHDCVSWANWVNSRCDMSLPIYLCGISMGASTVLMAAGLELPENVRGIIADCGYTSPEAIWRYVAKDNLGLSYGTRSAAVNGLCRKRIKVGIGDYSCVDAMAECEIPVLFIHGTDDKFVPIEMTYENFKACAGPKRLFVVPGAGHGMSYLVDTQGYQQAMKRFWAEFDQG
jgi:fermentation-respiration switch protein FrsA (DUF1100 family)